MRHLQFKSKQTAAIYVADGLAEPDREDFELHMMDCPACVEDVETWRALKRGIAAHERVASATPGTDGRPTAATPAPLPEAPRGATISPRAAQPTRVLAARHWQIAASAVLAACLGLFSGWFLRAGHGTAIDDDSIALATLSPLTRGTDCSIVRLAASTRVVALRIAGAQAGRRLVVTRADGSALGAGDYSVRLQPDQSWLVRLAGPSIVGKEVSLAAEATSGSAERLALGCVSAIVAP